MSGLERYAAAWLVGVAAILGGMGCERQNPDDPHPTKGVFVMVGDTYGSVNFRDGDGVEKSVIEDENGTVFKQWGFGMYIDGVEVLEPHGKLRLRVFDSLGNEAIFFPVEDPQAPLRPADIYERKKDYAEKKN